MAATIVDSLIVTLGLDPKNFTDGQKKALAEFKRTKEQAAATAKEMEARGKQGAKFFGLIKNAAMGLFTVLAGNVVIKAITQIANTTAATGRLASNIGLAAADLQAFTNMVERNGGSADAAAASYKGLADAIAEYKLTGRLPEGVQNAMGQIGATGAESPLELVKLFNQYAQGKDIQQTNAIGRMLGLDQGSINAALKSVQEFNAEIEKSHKLGLIDDADVKAAKDYQQAIVSLMQVWQDFEKTLAMGAMPALAAIFRAMTSIAIRDKDALKYFFGSKEEEPVRQGPTGGKLGGSSLLGLVRKLEGSGDFAVSPAGAVGRNQIMPATAKLYGFDPNRLKDPAYNDQVATAILNDLSQKYHGNTDQILANYNSSPRGTKKFMASGDPSTLPMETQKYLAHAHKLLAADRGGAGSGGGTRVDSHTQIGTIVINTRATDAGGIARDLAAKVDEANRNLALATQANQGTQ